MDFSKHVFRCHMVGDIISVPKPLTNDQSETLIAYNSRQSGIGKPLTELQEAKRIELTHKLNESKVYKLSDGAKKLLNKIVFYEKYNRAEILSNQYTEKGLVKEKEGRDLISEVLGFPLSADDERKTNDWVTGKRDYDVDDIIIEQKTKWSFETFNDSLLEKSNETYLRQLDSYMDLWNVKDSILCHVLVDSPTNLIEKEIYKKNYDFGFMSFDGDIYDWGIDEVKTIVCNHIYTRKGLEEFCQQSPIIHIEWFDDFIELSKKDRVHMVTHPYDQARIEQRNACISLAREYMNTVIPINNIVELTF
ncbi:hypothetical protein J2X97_000381 [Epilithonimonas hungarica]|uniref:hypothetical protein n=1 Tax=Epilithonimonas hungarica TaxID=454006 RepID=UPI0027868082|nr:hypothetical protein [Epilithonimonas hungarica]MDP9954744.1 hypothetical protein [Epilithonimonas hungarica]